MTNIELSNHIIRARCCLADNYYKLAQARALGLVTIQELETKSILLCIYVETLADVLCLDDVGTAEIEYTCLTADETQNVIENVYRICDCCNDDVFDDSLLNDLDLSNINNIY